MYRIYGCITQQHDIKLIVLAALVCLFACYSAFSLLTRAQVSPRRSRASWLAGAAVVAGGGVWATHFVAMLAFRPGFPLGYDVGLTALSVVMAIVLSGLGFWIALYGGRRLLGGATVGLAVGTMHYIGMVAVLTPATKHWDPVYAVSALAIGMTFGAVALWAGLRTVDLGARLCGAGLLALAIVGLHFTAMAAFELRPDPAVAVSDAVLAPALLGIAVAAVTLLIAGLAFFGSVVDQHMAVRAGQEAERLRKTVAELQKTRLELEARTVQVTAALEAAAAGSQAKSQFLAAMSHELRTPLNAIIGFAEILQGQLFGPIAPKYLPYVSDIHRSGAHLLGLINDVLDFSKSDAGRLDLYKEPVNIAGLVEEVTHLMRTQADKAGVRLHASHAADLPLVAADERRLRQVLLNLLSNAVKFTPEGGDVRVSAARAGGDVVISVADTGIGMKPDDIPIALERFRQVDCTLGRKYDGSGLGLPLAKMLVEMHGGLLAIESAVDVGTTVTVTLPGPQAVAQETAA